MCHCTPRVSVQIVTSPVHHIGHFAQSGTVVPMSPAVYRDIEMSIDVPAEFDSPDTVRLLFMQCRALECSMGLVCALALAQLYRELREHTGANNDILSKVCLFCILIPQLFM